MIYRTHLQDLKEVTAQIHYENYRHKRLKLVSSVPLETVCSTIPSPLETLPSKVEMKTASNNQTKLSHNNCKNNNYPTPTRKPQHQSTPISNGSKNGLKISSNRNNIWIFSLSNSSLLLNIKMFSFIACDCDGECL